MTDDTSLNFISQVIGGGISGAVGIIIAWYSFYKLKQQEIRETIYVPLYDSIMKLQLEPIFDGYADDTWDRMESHKKLRADKTIKTLYQRYALLRNSHYELLIGWENEFHNKVSIFTSPITEVFNSMSITQEGQLPLKSSYSVQILSFITWFRHILFDNTIKDPKELYEKLLDYSSIRYADFENWLKWLYDEKPECYDQLFLKLKEINKTFPENVDYKKLMEKRTELKELIIEIRKELKNRVTTSIFKKS